ncbi:MAG: hypothetical protein A2Y38_01430 [Spirochaetes bacterium GWB1_59_5]|nr:MAG: hypothetical protein A2Y38_01430 [Spirochaetes bacterium GWB1_59_5]
MLGTGYAITAIPIYQGWSPVQTGPGSNVVRAHAGNYVNRTPHLVAREAEPGASWPGSFENLMFLPDGRLVPATQAARDMFQGAGPEIVCAEPRASSFIRSLVPAASMFAGASLGFKLSSKHPGWGTLAGAVVGGILGRIFR